MHIFIIAYLWYNAINSTIGICIDIFMLKLKKIIYVALFTLLGILASFILHAIAEIWYIGLLALDFKKYSMGLSWANLYIAHYALSLLFLLGGFVAGFFQGLFWWTVIYSKKRKH